MTLQVKETRELLYRNRRYSVLFLAVFFAVGLTGIMLPLSFNFFLKLFPLALLLSFGLLLVFRHDTVNLRSYIIIAVIAAAGYLVEAYGVNTGKIFGNYTYGSSLGIKLFDTPLLIGVNWAMLVIATAYLADMMFQSVILKVVTGSVMMVIYDFIMEQAAGHLDMWHWDNNSIPVQNYLGWFAVSLLFHSVLRLSRANTGFYLALPVLICQLLFFITLSFFFHIIN
jgi:putative membrane protein